MWFDHAFGDWSQFTIEHLFKIMYQLQPNLLVNNRSSRGLKTYLRRHAATDRG